MHNQRLLATQQLSFGYFHTLIDATSDSLKGVRCDINSSDGRKRLFIACQRQLNAICINNNCNESRATVSTTFHIWNCIQINSQRSFMLITLQLLWDFLPTENDREISIKLEIYLICKMSFYWVWKWWFRLQTSTAVVPLAESFYFQLLPRIIHDSFAQSSKLTTNGEGSIAYWFHHWQGSLGLEHLVWKHSVKNVSW
jgi:hypothetical protein